MAYSWEFVLSAMFLIYIVRNPKAANYYCKFIYFYCVLISVVTVLIPYFMLKPRNVRNFLACSALLRHISKVVGIKWELRGAANLSQDRTCVFVANHQSSLDSLGLLELWPTIRKMTVAGKREFLYAGTFGISMYLAGVIFINRKVGGQASKTINSALKDMKAKNIKLWIFPEGTTKNTGDIHEFKKEAFHAAIQAQVPIVPVVFSSYKSFMDGGKNIFKNGEVIVTALPVIPTKGLVANDVEDLIKRTRNMMVEVFNKTTKEVAVKMSTSSNE